MSELGGLWKWIMETLKCPACTVDWVVRLCRSWLSPGKATRIFHGRNPNGKTQLHNNNNNHKQGHICCLKLPIQLLLVSVVQKSKSPMTRTDQVFDGDDNDDDDDRHLVATKESERRGRERRRERIFRKYWIYQRLNVLSMFQAPVWGFSLQPCYATVTDVISWRTCTHYFGCLAALLHWSLWQ